jgi:two-component system CheB/CheR fusion protein
MVDLQHTLLTDRLTEREMQTRDGLKTYLMRILPYTVPSSSVRGAVASFIDVTSLHAAKRLQTVVDALPEHVAVVDLGGKIVMVNAAWRRFATANGDADLSRCGVGVNYLSVCQSELDDDDAGRAARGLRGVLEGSLPHFSMEYPCHSPTEKRWFVMNVTPVVGGPYGAVVSHMNISKWHA